MPRRFEHVLEHLGRLGVLAGQHPVAAAHQDDVRRRARCRRWRTRRRSRRTRSRSAATGSSSRSYTCSQVRMRSPSGVAVGSTRGCAPVASSTTSAGSSLLAVLGGGDHALGAVEPAACRGRSGRPPCRAAAAMSRALLLGQRFDPLVDGREVDGDRLRAAAVADDRSARPPNRSAELARLLRPTVITSAVAMRVFDGTQSVSTAEPPSPSRSTRVTSAPS